MPLKHHIGPALPNRQAVSTGPMRLKRPILQSYTDSPDIEYDQFKFACREAYEETADLELKYNHLVVSPRSRDDEAVGVQFLRFPELIGAAKYSWLRRCSIYPIDRRGGKIRPGHKFLPDTSTTIARIASFCNGNLSVGVHYTIPIFGKIPNSCSAKDVIVFVHTGMYYMHILRNKKLPVMARYEPKFKGEDWAQTIEIQTLQAPNLRFRPARDSFNEADRSGVCELELAVMGYVLGYGCLGKQCDRGPD
jgi:hypothetical protein